MSGPDIHAEARERYEQVAAAIRAGWILGHDAVPIVWPEASFSPLRDWIPRAYVRELLEKRLAEDRDRRAWIRHVKRRLCLVGPGEVLHRTWVRRGLFRWEPSWTWSCQVPQCAGSTGYMSQAAAFEAAFAHSSAWLVPQMSVGGAVTVRMPWSKS